MDLSASRSARAETTTLTGEAEFVWPARLDELPPLPPNVATRIAAKRAQLSESEPQPEPLPAPEPEPEPQTTAAESESEAYRSFVPPEPVRAEPEPSPEPDKQAPNPPRPKAAKPPTIGARQPSDEGRNPPTKAGKKRRACPLPQIKDHSWEGKADGAWESWHAPDKARDRSERVYLGRVGKRQLADWLKAHTTKASLRPVVEEWVAARRAEKGIT